MGKSIIRRRRENGATCFSCGSPDYDIYEPVVGEQTKPTIWCNSCGSSWSYGYDGGKYAEFYGKPTKGQDEAKKRRFKEG